MKIFNRVPLLLAASALLLAAGGCSSRYPITIKVHSQPEGAYVFYKLDLDNPYEPAEWVELGNTPLNAIKNLDGWDISDKNTISLKASYPGYAVQTKSWSAEQFYNEYKKKGMIFWNPQLVPAQVPAQ